MPLPPRPSLGADRAIMAAQQKTMLAMGVAQITQYAGKEMVDLKVEVDVPGSWFAGTDAGSLGGGGCGPTRQEERRRMPRRKERRRREAKSRCERWAAATSAHDLNAHSQDSAVLYFPVFSVVWVLSAQCKCQSVHSVLSAVTVL